MHQQATDPVLVVEDHVAVQQPYLMLLDGRRIMVSQFRLAQLLAKRTAPRSLMPVVPVALREAPIVAAVPVALRVATPVALTVPVALAALAALAAGLVGLAGVALVPRVPRVALVRVALVPVPAHPSDL